MMSAAAYLERVPDPNEQQVREMLSGHLCRCTGYTPIVAAVLDVAAQRLAKVSSRGAAQAIEESSDV
jgi:2-furoyl-CoA dehydrogenase 2Fe-2S iron sulfur subunit